MFEYVGAIHIHSKFSDGTGSADEIASYANEVGLDYIMLTDHNTLRAKKEGFEKWYGNTLLLVGCEINDKYNKNHYIAFGLAQSPSTRLSAKEYVQQIENDGGFGFIAHPHEKRSSMKEHPAYPWFDWSIRNFSGIEIWNHMSEWMEGLTEENKYNYFIHPLKSIVAPLKDTLDVWDKLNLERKVVGIGGVDAHAHKVNLLGFFEVEIFPYKVLFKSIRTHILSEKKIVPAENQYSVEKAKEIIYNALRYGRCFVSNYYHGDAKGFRFFAEDENNIYQMGDAVDFKKGIKLRVILPKVSARIKLLQNGNIIHIIEDFDADFIVSEPGVYRVEVYIDNKAWLFSNHIRIGL